MSSKLKFDKDPENIGWVGCVHINVPEKSILLVKNIKRESRIDEELERRGLSVTHRNRMKTGQELLRQGAFKYIKPSRWELPGGKIPFWAGNPQLQKEFRKLNPEVDVVFKKKTKLTHIANEEQLKFLQKVGWRVLADENLLLPASEQTAYDEVAQETGLIVRKLRLLFKTNGKDTHNANEIYPKFWYFVDKTEGELRKEPEKKTVSPPLWVPLAKLQFGYKKGQGQEQFAFHLSHLLGVYKAVEELAKNYLGFSEILEYLKTEFPQITEQLEDFETANNWEKFTQSTQPLN